MRVGVPPAEGSASTARGVEAASAASNALESRAPESWFERAGSQAAWLGIRILPVLDGRRTF